MCLNSVKQGLSRPHHTCNGVQSKGGCLEVLDAFQAGGLDQAATRVCHGGVFVFVCDVWWWWWGGVRHQKEKREAGEQEGGQEGQGKA